MNPTPAMSALAVIVASVRKAGSGPSSDHWFDEHGMPREPDAVNAAARTLLDQLAWWAHTLQHARTAHPYGT